jgi:hypothetical protein
VAFRKALHDTRLAVRVRKRELAAWKKAADRADEPLSAWIRKGLNLLAAGSTKPVPPAVKK